MSLPTSYSDPGAYFDEVLDYFEKYSWIFQYSNTKFLRAGVMDCMPLSFREYFIKISLKVLNRFPDLRQQLSNLPEELQIFRNNLIKLTPNLMLKESINYDRNSMRSALNLYMNPKKQHEVQELSKKILDILFNSKMEESLTNKEAALLIDLGAGLGYLHKEIINYLPNCWILALESNKCFVQKAQKLIESNSKHKEFTNLKINPLQRILYKEHRIEEDASKDFIESYLQSFEKENDLVLPKTWSLIGLHACGDLSITSMKLFLNMNNVRHLIIAPCCYHKLQQNILTNWNSDYPSEFQNFPLSKTFYESIKRRSNLQTTNKYLNRPFLRLACQETFRRWYQLSEKDHEKHGKRMFQRSLADAIIDEKTELIQIQSSNKKDNINHSDNSNLDGFEEFSQYYQILSKDTKVKLNWNEEHRGKFDKLWTKYQTTGTKLAEGLTCLQTAMQKLCENVVLYDRICFLEESALEKNLQIYARYEKIFDESLSPRCLVLIVEKFN